MTYKLEKSPGGVGGALTECIQMGPLSQKGIV